MTGKPLDGEILGPEPTEDHSAHEETVRKGFWPKVKRTARHIPFTHDLVAAYYCALDPEVPMRVRGTLLAALAYFIVPLDAVPDFLIGIGFGDDITVLMGAITMVAAHITDRHRQKAKDALED